jgi:hypothetical protein
VPAPAVAPPKRLDAGGCVVVAAAFGKRLPPLGAEDCVAPNMLDPVVWGCVVPAAGAPNKLPAGLGVVDAAFPKRPPVVLVAPGVAVDVDVDVLLPL